MFSNAKVIITAWKQHTIGHVSLGSRQGLRQRKWGTTTQKFTEFTFIIIVLGDLQVIESNKALKD